MIRALFLRLAFLLIFAQGCKKKEVEDPHMLKGSFGMYLNLHVIYPYLDPHGFIPSLPKCDSTPIVHKNIQVSVQPASKDESPAIQQCAVGPFMASIDRFFILPGTQLKIDVSFYKGIKHVAVGAVGGGDGSTFATAYGTNGKVIERKTGNYTFIFDKNLDDLKEITIVDQKVNLFPQVISLSDQLPK